MCSYLGLEEGVTELFDCLRVSPCDIVMTEKWRTVTILKVNDEKLYLPHVCVSVGSQARIGDGIFIFLQNFKYVNQALLHNTCT